MDITTYELILREQGLSDDEIAKSLLTHTIDNSIIDIMHIYYIQVDIDLNMKSIF